MIPKRIEAISKQDIDALVANAVSEGRNIEYKSEPVGSKDEERREFLADASSFANASGGDLIFGVREKKAADGKATGTPEAADGLKSINPDAEMRRLEDMLRNSIDPRIPGIQLRHIDGFTDGPVIILRIPKSWASPHMVTFRGTSRFYTRTSAGKHQMDVREIRAAFEITSSIKQRIEAFRADRLAKILTLETPAPTSPWPKCVLHLFPFAAADYGSHGADVAVRAYESPNFQPFYNTIGLKQFNFDGALCHFPSVERGTRAYVQVFRSGIIEGVMTCPIIEKSNRRSNEEQDAKASAKSLSAGAIEGQVRHTVSNLLRLLGDLDQQPPIVLMLSFVEVKGAGFTIDSPYRSYDHSVPIDREVLPLPEAIIDSFDIKVDEVLRPIFDVAWQSSGQPRSKNYNPQGTWDSGLSEMPGFLGGPE